MVIGRIFVVLVALALGGAVGCDRVFGLDRPPSEAGVDADADVPPDAHIIGEASGLMGFSIATDLSGSPLAILDVRGASATIIGTPHTFVPFTLAATSGTFSPTSGEIEIGPGGTIIVASTFTAGATPVADGTATLASGPMSRMISAVTFGLARLGPATQNGNTAMTAGAQFGTQVIQLPPARYLKRMGIVVQNATNAYLGVYADVAGGPAGKLATVGPVALTAGTNELAITNVLLPTTFWVVATLETAQPSLPAASSINTDRYFRTTATFGPLPASLAGTSVSTSVRYMQYVQVAQ